MGISPRAAQGGVSDWVRTTGRASLQAVDLVERGLPISELQVLSARGFTPGELNTLVIPARTLKHRKDKKQPLSMEETDRALRLLRTLDLADSVFANHDKALRWLRRASKRLDGRAPIDLLRSEAGSNVARQMLYQIDEGMFV